MKICMNFKEVLKISQNTIKKNTQEIFNFRLNFHASIFNIIINNSYTIIFYVDQNSCILLINNKNNVSAS